MILMVATLVVSCVAIGLALWTLRSIRIVEARRDEAWRRLHELAALMEARGVIGRRELVRRGLDPVLLDDALDTLRF